MTEQIEGSIEIQPYRKIRYDVRYINSIKDKTLLVFIHGFRGFRNWGFIPYFCEKFAEAGYITLNMDLSYNGIVDWKIPIYDNDLFSRQTVSSMVEDIEILHDRVLSNQIIPKEANFNGKIILSGHSLGAALALVMNDLQNVSKSILIAPIAKFDRNTQRQKDSWLKKGEIEIKIAKTGQKLTLLPEYFLDKDINFPGDYIISKAKQSTIRTIVLHGSEDMTVKTNEGKAIANANPEKIVYYEIPNTGHTFGSRHPYRSTNDSIELLIDKSLEFANG